MTKEMRKLIECHLACLDSYNAMNEGDMTKCQKLFHELIGMKLMLSAMGIALDLEINPYYFENGNPSTYTVRLEDDCD